MMVRGGGGGMTSDFDPQLGRRWFVLESNSGKLRDVGESSFEGVPTFTTRETAIAWIEKAQALSQRCFVVVEWDSTWVVKPTTKVLLVCERLGGRTRP
jgi:hypothetical protein